VDTHQLQVERRTSKAHRPKTDALPLDHAVKFNIDHSSAPGLTCFFKILPSMHAITCVQNFRRALAGLTAQFLNLCSSQSFCSDAAARVTSLKPVTQQPTLTVVGRQCGRCQPSMLARLTPAQILQFATFA